MVSDKPVQAKEGEGGDGRNEEFFVAGTGGFSTLIAIFIVFDIEDEREGSFFEGGRAR